MNGQLEEIPNNAAFLVTTHCFAVQIFIQWLGRHPEGVIVSTSSYRPIHCLLLRYFISIQSKLYTMTGSLMDVISDMSFRLCTHFYIVKLPPDRHCISDCDQFFSFLMCSNPIAMLKGSVGITFDLFYDLGK